MRKCFRPEELKNHLNQTEISMPHEQLEESFQELVEVTDVLLNALLKSKDYIALNRKFANFCVLCCEKSEDYLNIKIL